MYFQVARVTDRGMFLKSRFQVQFSTGRVAYIYCSCVFLLQVEIHQVIQGVLVYESMNVESTMHGNLYGQQCNHKFPLHNSSYSCCADCLKGCSR